MSLPGRLPPQVMGVMVRPVVVSVAPLKRCWLCGEWRPLSEFSANRTRPDGLSPSDRTCHGLYLRERRAAVAARRAVQLPAQRRHHAAHREQIAVYNARYYQAHRERLLERARLRYQARKLEKAA